MMKKSTKYMSMLAGALLLSGVATGCTDDILDAPGTGDDTVYQIDESEYGLGVVLSLDQLTGTSSRSQIGGPLGNLAGGTGQGLKDIEEYVNTENLYILFFNIDGTFLFQINKPTAVPIGQSEFGNDNQWFIKIPVADINENLIHYIEENPFKIAVLANWTFDADVNLGENLSGWDEFKFNEPLDEDGNLKIDDYGKLQGDHISLLSHAQRDNVYENTTMHGYDHLVYRTETGPHMGPYTEWVANYHRSIDEADADIRANFDVKNNKYSNPASKYENNDLNHFKIEYNNIWHVWNFGGNDDSKFIFDAGEQQKAEWLALNQEAKKSFSDEYMGLLGSTNSQMLKWRMKNYENLEIPYYPNFATYLKFQDSDAMSFNGIVIAYPNISASDNKTGNPLNLTLYNNGTPTPYLHFKVNADGYVRINYEATGGAKLYAHVGLNNTKENNASGYQKSNRDNRYLVNEDGYLVQEGSNGKQIADIPFEPKDVYIYMVVEPEEADSEDVDPDDGTIDPEESDGSEESEEDKPETVPPTVVDPFNPATVVIYGIEYIESRHLYDVDRRGILPSKDYPIPMYGIQDFDPIGEYWEPGVLFNLSQYNNAQKMGYNYRNVSLLRSLSRVEVMLDKTAFKQKPAHVFLRSMNRSARITPVDFFTPTDIIWNGFNSSSVSDIKRLQNYINSGNLEEQKIIQNTPGVVQEEKNIMQYGPIYIGTNANSGQSSTQKLNEYRKTTAWPFGIWEHQWGWDWNRGNGYVDNFDTYQVGQTRAHTGQTVPEYPRILHTRISRSDYARFTEVEDPNYWHYIIYIPEKNITDADNPGNIADRPKIIHVELRFNGGPDDGDTSNDEDNYVDNFDDKAAYRLYFTEGGRANLGNFDFTGRESWDAYEYDLEIAKQHWPILRNHVYTFTVKGIPSYRDNVNFQAESPDNRVTSWEFK